MSGRAEREPAISVVVPTLDRTESAVALVRALLEGSEAPLEVIVVDQSEGDETRAALEQLDAERIRHVRHAPPSTSVARNVGARLAGGEYVGFLDDDLEVPHSWLAALRGEIRRFGLPDAVFGSVLPPEGFAAGRTRLPVSLFQVDEPRAWERPVHPNRVGYATNFACSRESFLELGGFDARLGPGSRFRAAEDMDFAYRLLKAGLRVVSTPRFEVVHLQWRSPAELPGLFYGYNLGGAAFCAKHLRAGDLGAGRFLLEQVVDDARMLGSAVRRGSGLRARVAAARAAGTWRGLLLGLRALGGGSPPGPGTSPGSPPAADS